MKDVRLEDIFGMVHFNLCKKINDCDIVVVITSAKRRKLLFKNKEVTEFPFEATFNNGKFTVYDDFYDYTGKKNDRKDMFNHLSKYKSFFWSNGRFNTFRVYYREGKIND